MLPLFYHRRVCRLTKHDILEDYQKERPGNHNAYSLTLSITVRRVPPMTDCQCCPFLLSTCTTCTNLTQWPMLCKKQCKNSRDNARREHAAGMVRGCNTSLWQASSESGNLVNPKVYITVIYTCQDLFSSSKIC